MNREPARHFRQFRAFADPHGPVHIASSRWPSIVRCGRPKARLHHTQPDRHDAFCLNCLEVANHAANGNMSR